MNKMKASYSIVDIDHDLNFVLIRDRNGSMSITNDANNVVEHVDNVLRQRLNLTLDDFPSHKIFYFDSTGSIDLLKKDEAGNFDGFEFYGLKSLEELKKLLEKK